MIRPVSLSMPPGRVDSPLSGRFAGRSHGFLLG